MADYYALDDTIAGRLIQAGLVGALVAVPDLVPAGSGRRTLARLGITVAGVGAAAVANAMDEDDEALSEVLEQPEENDPKALAIGLGIVTGLGVLCTAGTAAAARALAKRGVSKPYLALGGIIGLGSWALSIVVDRSQEKEGTLV